MPSPVEQIKSRLDLVDVIQSYIKVHRAGANFKANCPFHNEKTPSFFISPAREIWHCFGCGKGGDLIKFVMEIEGVEFPEALRMLASRAGVELVREDPREKDERARAFKIMEDATAFFENELPKHADIEEYLKGRGLLPTTIKDFRIGFAPASWDALLTFLKSKGYSGEEAESAGLAIKSTKESGRYYDRFRSRIMFPIADSAGRIVGFSGRISPEAARHGGEEAAKYVNTPQTMLYDKSKILYCFDRAKLEIRKVNSCVLVEGQMDAVMSHQAGIKNAVAVSGTALTGYQLTMIKRLADNLITAFDMDAAGNMATRRGIDLALAEGLEVRVAVINGGKDPADLVRDNSDAWHKSVEEAKNILDFYLDTLSIKYKNDARELRKQTGALVLPYIARLPSEIDKAHWVGEVAKRLNLSEQPIWDEMRKLRFSGAPSLEKAAPAATKAEKTRKQLLEEKILGMALWSKDAVAQAVAERDSGIFSESTKPFIIKAIAGEAIDTDPHKDYLNRLAWEAELFYGNTDKDLSAEAAELLAHLEKEHVKERMAKLAASIRDAERSGDAELLTTLTAEFGNLSKKLA